MTPARFRRLAARAALVGCLSAGVIACGDDDDTGTDTEADTDGTDEQAAGGDACGAIVEFNTAVSDSDTEGASEDELKELGEELASLWAPVEENAPDDVADEATEIGTALDDLATGDPEGFQDEAIFETYSAVLEGIVSGCGFEAISAHAVDFAFEGLPETVPAGTVVLELTNKSEAEMHEIILFKKAEGETRTAEEILNDPASEEDGPGEFAGAAFAPPGQSASSLTDLAAGDYIAVCFIPVGSGEITEEQAAAGEGGPPHFTQGMFAEFTVE